jgi:hypothetical protein
MISRRQLIGSGIAISGLGLGARLASAVETRSLFPACETLLIDTRFPEALGIARRVAPPTATIVSLPRDVLALWHDRLKPRHGTAPAFAGVTTEHGFFTLRTLAADYRLRVLFSEEHVAAQTLVAWVIGPAAPRA